MDIPDSKVTEFKQRVDKEWNTAEVAAAWQKHYLRMKEQFAAVTQALVDAAMPEPGMSVLDLASGTGEPALPIARRVAPGKVTATDLSAEMLKALLINAEAQGIQNITASVQDAHSLQFPDASFDLVTSRWGPMFFAEIDKALAEIRRVLKPGGRIAFMVWGAPEPGSYFGAAAMPFLRRLATKPDPDGPGPMRFAKPGKFKRLIENAGFRNAKEEILSLPAPFKGSPEELLALMMEIAAPFRNAAATLSDQDRADAEKEALANLAAHYDGAVTTVTAPVIILTATR